MKRPKRVCAIIPTYNRPDLLRRAIVGILNQSAEVETLAVCSDGPSTAVRGVCAEFRGSQLQLIEGAHSGRPARTRNLALPIVAGSDFVAFCDDDDVWQRDKIAVQLAAMEEHGFDVLGSHYTRVSGRGELLPGGVTTGGSGVAAVSLLRLVRANVFNTSSVVMRSALLLALGGFCESAPTWEDYDLWVRAVCLGARAGVLERPLVNTTIHEGVTAAETESLRSQAVAHIRTHVSAARSPAAWALLSVRRLRIRSWLNEMLRSVVLG